MADFGLTVVGFAIKSEDDITSDINDALRADLGPTISPGLTKGYFGRITRIFAERVASVWELGEAINASQDPNAAGGASLDSLCALTGTLREAATSSTVTLTWCGTPTTVVPAGSQGGTAAGDRFATLASAAITALTAWAPSTTYAIGDRATNAARCYECAIAGASASSGGPTTNDVAIVDGAATWRYIGEGSGAADADADSVATGPIAGRSGDINIIESAIGGAQSVLNIHDAVLGTIIESDSALRVRRRDELDRPGTSTVDAIRVDVSDALRKSDLLAIVTVFENSSDVINADGMPPHSIEVLVQSTALDQAIADAILGTIGAGIATTGTSSANSSDSAGNVHEIRFTRPTLTNVYVAITVLVQDAIEADDYPDEPTWPADGAAEVADAIAAFGAKFVVSRSVYAAQCGARAFDVPGVIDLIDVKVGTAPSPAATKVAIGSRDLAIFDSSRVAVTVVDS